MKSPIRYYGGKGLLSEKIVTMFPNNYKYDRYIEPFGGGASVLFSKIPSPVEIYNDINQNVFSLFNVLSDRDKFEKLKEKLFTTYYSDTLRKIYNSSEPRCYSTIHRRIEHSVKDFRR